MTAQLNNDAFEDIETQTAAITTAKLSIGAAFQGEFLGYEESRKYEGKQNLLIKDETGKELVVFTSGNLNYAKKDDLLEVGRVYKITRLENRINKKGLSITQFRIQRLKADGAVAAPTENNVKPEGRQSKK